MAGKGVPRAMRRRTVRVRYTGPSYPDLAQDTIGDAAPTDGYDDPKSMQQGVMLFWEDGMPHRWRLAHFINDDELVTVKETK